MEIYIKINNKEIPLTNEQVKEIQQSFGITNTKLADITVGETFKIGEYEFIVLEHSKETTAVILKDLLFERKEFGKTNNYKSSCVDKVCDEFANTISNIIGSENLIEHTVDLIADDGLKDYGTIKRRMSLLTANLYRRYVEILDNHKIGQWWWLATAYSTPKHENANWVKCVSPCGDVNGNYSCSNDNGVRPFCILNSNIFVSK